MLPRNGESNRRPPQLHSPLHSIPIQHRRFAMNQVAPACIHPYPPVVIGDDRLNFLKTEIHPIESGILEEKFISDMAALMVEAHPRGPGSMPPGEGNPHDIIGINQVRRRSIQIELRKDSLPVSPPATHYSLAAWCRSRNFRRTPPSRH
jgi:hypothetical protein